MLVDAFNNGFNMRIEQRIALAIEFHLGQKRKEGRRHRFKSIQWHMTSNNARLIQILLAAADLATEIAFVRERKTGVNRRRNIATSTFNEVAPLRMQ